MADIAQLGYDVNTTELKAAEREVDRLTSSTLQADRATRNFGGAAATAGRNLNQLSTPVSNLNRGVSGLVGGNGLRQVGLQLSQVAQQSQVTGRPLQALAVQLPDIGLAFGTVGIAAGVLAGLLLPLAANLLSTGDAVVPLRDRLDGLADAMAALETINDRSRQGFVALRQEFGASSAEASRLLDIQRRIAQVEAERALTNTSGAISRGFGITPEDLAFVSVIEEGAQGVARLQNELRDVERTFAATFDNAERVALATDRINLESQLEGAQRLEAVVANLTQTLGVSDDTARRLASSFAELGNTDGAEAQANILFEIANTISLATGNLADADEETRELYNSLLDAGVAALQLSQTDIASPISVAASESAILAENLGLSLAAAQALATARSPTTSGDRTNGFGGFESGDPRSGNGPIFTGETNRTNRFQFPSVNGSISGGGGGGGAADPYEASLNRLIQSLETEREVVERWHAESEQLLIDARAREYLTEEQHRDSLVRLEEEYHERISNIRSSSQNQTLSESASFFGSLAGIAAAGGQSTARAVATFSAVQATINSYLAATQVLTDPSLGFFGKAAAYASVLATGLQGVAAIRQAGGSSGASSSGLTGSGGAVTASTAEVQEPEQRVILDFGNSPEWVRDMMEEVAEQMFVESSNGRRIVVQRA